MSSSRASSSSAWRAAQAWWKPRSAAGSRRSHKSLRATAALASKQLSPKRARLASLSASLATCAATNGRRGLLCEGPKFSRILRGVPGHLSLDRLWARCCPSPCRARWPRRRRRRRLHSRLPLHIFCQRRLDREHLVRRRRLVGRGSHERRGRPHTRLLELGVLRANDLQLSPERMNLRALKVRLHHRGPWRRSG